MASVFELFHIGIGPSSSHTVGPMKAALMFATQLDTLRLWSRLQRIVVTFHGSLGATGKGHGSDKGVLLGLSGERPDTVQPQNIEAIVSNVRSTRQLHVLAKHTISFDPLTDMLFKTRPLPAHPNGLVFQAFDAQGALLDERRYYSVGGGAVHHDDGQGGSSADSTPQVPYPFDTAVGLLAQCETHGLSVDELMLRNELSVLPLAEVNDRLDRIWAVMQDCVQRGTHAQGELPGPLRVKRRARALYESLASEAASAADSLHAMDWLNLCAMAVSEENAAGGQVVTAPTNGAAGIIPSVLHYYMKFIPGADVAGVRKFLLVAAAIGTLYKANASISGAEVGCQGEVGVACSMAAGGLCAVLGGAPEQIEHAAEIAMEHHLGLTCDPVGGLVQIPCIERNAVASAKAVNAARLAIRTREKHHVSLDAVIRTMWETGQDMKTKYKETARGGLAINIKLC